ncbi:unnamed protein product [Prunus brigantina]
MKFFAVCLTDFCLLLVKNDVHKKLDLGPDTTNVHQVLNILGRFCVLHWLLSEHQKEAGGLPPAEDVERWELHGSDLDDLPAKRQKFSTKLPHSSSSKSSVKGSRLLRMSLWELLVHHVRRLLRSRV